MSSQINSLHKALPLVAAAYGQKMGVKVSIGRDDASAYTDGNTIVVPNISTDKYPKEVVWGYLAHEASHVRFTDFRVRRAPGVHAALTNIIEDARIEREMVKAYPGVAQDLDAIWAYLKKAGHIQDVSPDTPAAGILQMYCLYFLRCKQLGQSMLQDSLTKAEEALASAYQKGARIRLNGLLRQVASISSTYQAAKLAHQILDMLQEEATNPSQPDSEDGEEDSSPDTNSTSSDDSDSGEGASASAEGDGEAEDETGGDGQPSSGSGDSSGDPNDAQASGGEDGEQSSSSNGDSSSTDEGSGDASQAGGRGAGGSDSLSDSDAADIIERVLSAGQDDLSPDPMNTLKQEMVSDSDASDAPATPVVVPSTGTDSLIHHGSKSLGEEIQDHVKATSNKLQRRLHGLIEATQRQPVRSARRGKRIDTKRLARAATGDMRVFSAKQEVKGPNTAIHVLVDMSGSMMFSNPQEQGQHFSSATSMRSVLSEVDSRKRAGGIPLPFQVARNATMALAQALNRIKGVNLGVTAFSSDVTSVLKHGETINTATLSRFGVEPFGGTRMAEALWYSAVELSKTKEERKVIIVLSDGDPDNGDAVRHAVRQLSGSVEFVGIGILNGAISNYIDNSKLVNDLGDLESTLMDVARASILKA